jgi:hypothetical protein
VIAVGMAIRDREDSLRKQIADAVRHGAGRQQDESSIRPLSARSRRRPNSRLADQTSRSGSERPCPKTEQSVLSSARSNARASRGKKARVVTALYHVEAFVFLPTTRADELSGLTIRST